MIFRSFTAKAFCFAWAAAVSAATTAGAFAATYYWDTNGSTAGIGSAGGAPELWLSNSWATGSSGTLPTGPWPNTQPDNDDEAVFMGTAGTVNVDADVYANALTFQTNGYTIASTGGALHLVGTTNQIDAADYDFWNAHFGQTAGSGSHADSPAVVPEPAAMLLVAAALSAIISPSTPPHRARQRRRIPGAGIESRSHLPAPIRIVYDNDSSSAPPGIA